MDLYLETAFVASLTAAIALLTYRLAPLLGLAELPIPTRATAAGVVALVILGPAAAAALLRGGRNPRRAAVDADAALRLDQRLATALEHPQSRFAPLLRRELEPRIGATRPHQVYPVPRLGYRAGAALAIAALALVALAPAGLTWEWVREHPLSVVGLDDPPPPVAETARPELKIEAVPREGDAPLRVYFLGFARGAQPPVWEWDFGDGTVVQGERQQEHVYEKPGKYTITLRAAGGEVIERDMIEVRGPQDGGGGDGLIPVYPDVRPEDGGNSGAESGRPEIETRPENVTPFDDGKGDLVEKERSVYTPGPGGADVPPTPEEFARAYEEYRRVAEEALGRERIPAPMADFVRAYFDRIRPR